MLRSPDFYIQHIPVYGDLILAPMDGYSDQPFRSLCRELGSALSYTEFINAQYVLSKRHKLLPRRLAFLPEERPVVYQIFDNDPERLLQAALILQNIILQDKKPDVIDINMGCSAPNVSGRGAGAGLLREPQKVAQIISTLARELDVPVSAKIRLGWDEQKRNYLEIARVIEENGAALLAVHARTRAQGFSGQADWDAIAEIKQAVSIPVVANGDVRTVEDIERIQRITGCEAVMIGRAAIGNPWIFSRLDRSQVTSEQLRSTMLRHLDKMLAFYGNELGLKRFRKHASLYLKPLGLARETRIELLTADTPEEFLEVFDSLHF
jgi:tRNA-dihydrouridine synthase B